MLSASLNKTFLFLSFSFCVNHQSWLIKFVIIILCLINLFRITMHIYCIVVFQKALELSQKIYGCETVQQALAHRAVSKALMVVQQFDSSEHYQHAMEAIRIARSLLPDGHPMLNIFLQTFCKSSFVVSIVYHYEEKI